MVRRGGKKLKKDKKNVVDDRDKFDSDNKIKYFDIVRENQIFNTYYRCQNIVENEEEWDEFITFLRKPLPAAFRINASCFGQTQALKNLVESEKFGNLLNSENNKIKLTKLNWSPNFLAYQIDLSRIEIRKSEKLQNLHSFLLNECENGYISRQEAVSMIPPLVLDVKTHHKVLDLCAAPGSKTAQIIEFLHFEENKDIENFLHNPVDSLTNELVVANDLNNSRCYMLLHQSKRLKSPLFLITNHDASTIPNFYQMLSDGSKQILKFDRIVCDVPCSGDGTLRKNIEIWSKWAVTNGNQFHGLQSKIVKRATELLQKDGLMVYSTCSFNPMENEAVIANLLNEAKGSLELVDIKNKLQNLKFKEGLETWKVMQKDLKIVNNMSEVDSKFITEIKESLFPPENTKELNLKRCIRILPHFQNTGGFFIALIKKKTSKMPWEKEFDESQKNEKKLFIKKKNFDKRTIGFKEEPFFFIEKDDIEWLKIKNYYNISEKFPYTQLVYRSEKVKKNLYFLTESAINILKTNENQIKFINAGIRMFSKIQDKVANCSHRLTQEGLFILYPYLDKSKIINISKDELQKILVSSEYVQIENLETDTQKELSKFQSGCVVLQYIMDVKYDDDTLKPMYLPFVCWKGKSTIRPFIVKHERIHLMRISGLDISYFELERKKKFFNKQQRRNDRLKKITKLMNNQNQENNNLIVKDEKLI